MKVEFFFFLSYLGLWLSSLHPPQQPHHGHMGLCNFLQRHQIVSQKWDLTSKINKDLSKETQLHILTLQSWCAWGCLEGCHSPQLLNVGFFPGEHRSNVKTNKKRLRLYFKQKGSKNHRMAEAPQWGHLLQHRCSSRIIPNRMAQDSTQTALKYLQWAGAVAHKIISENTFATLLLDHQSAGTAKNVHFLCNRAPSSLSSWMHWVASKCKMTIHSQRYTLWEYSLTASPPVMDTKLIPLCSVNHNRN